MGLLGHIDLQSVQDISFPKSPIFDPNDSFLLQNPSRTSIFPKRPMFNLIFFYQKSLHVINFRQQPLFSPKCPISIQNPFICLGSCIFNPSATFLPKSPFRTSIFPESPIFNLKALFLSKIPLKLQFSFKAPFSTHIPFLPQNSFRRSVFPKNA